MWRPSHPPATVAGVERKESGVIVLRQVIGDELRRRRQDQGRTLRDVSAAAAVSLGYLSEVERGQKEASSELLAAICGALDVPLSDILSSVTDQIAEVESEDVPALAT
jgi:transcriptional regulator with XRE-family HTH domain